MRRVFGSYLNRFLSADTIVPNPNNPQSFNRYSYSYNNPLRYSDPSGHSPVCEMLPDECQDSSSSSPPEPEFNTSCDDIWCWQNTVDEWELQLVAAELALETRGEGHDLFYLMAWIVRNRYDSGNYSGIADVMFSPNQFQTISHWFGPNQIPGCSDCTSIYSWLNDYPNGEGFIPREVAERFSGSVAGRYSTDFTTALSAVRQVFSEPSEMNPLPGVNYFGHVDTLLDAQKQVQRLNALAVENGDLNHQAGFFMGTTTFLVWDTHYTVPVNTNN